MRLVLADVGPGELEGAEAGHAGETPCRWRALGACLAIGGRHGQSPAPGAEGSRRPLRAAVPGDAAELEGLAELVRLVVPEAPEGR